MAEHRGARDLQPGSGFAEIAGPHMNRFSRRLCVAGATANGNHSRRGRAGETIGAAMPNSALFLDRDGVINVDHGYVHRPDQFEFIPGIFELARFWTNEVKRPIVVTTNQSGIGRGYFDQSTYAALTRWMCDRFEAEGTAISRVYHCPHPPSPALTPLWRAWASPAAIIPGANQIPECSCRLYRILGLIRFTARSLATR